MKYLKVLRRLVVFKQFEALKGAAEDYWNQSGDSSTLPLMALACAYLGKNDELQQLLEQIEALETALDLDARVDLAAVYMVMKKLDPAVALLEEALKEAPEHPLALAHLGFCRSRSSQKDEARRLYEQSLAIEPSGLEVYRDLIRICLKQEDFLAAQRWIDIAVARLNEMSSEMGANTIFAHIKKLRDMQLSLWVASQQFSRMEAWLETQRGKMNEAQWCQTLLQCVAILAGADLHEQAFDMLKEGLKHYPKHIELYDQLAQLALLQGHVVQGANLIRRAIRLADEQGKPTVLLWCKLSEGLLHRDEENARQAAEKAVEIADAMEVDEAYSESMIRTLRMRSKQALAQVESQSHQFEKADAMFRELLEEDPNFVPALQGLGQQQMQLGHIDEAVTLFERMKEIVPAKGYAALINARQFPEDSATLDKIERVARQPSMGGSASVGLLFQLASAWEKRGEYDKAFALVNEANAISKRNLNYNRKTHRNRCGRVRDVFSQVLFDNRKEHGVDSGLPVFVVGMPRSGTTLVEQILAGHSEIFGAGELGLIPQVVQGMERWERHTGSGRHYPECVDDMKPEVSAAVAENVLKELRAFDEGAKHVVDKLPHNFENIGLIKFLFPNAKIISVCRDARDIAVSNYFTDYQAKHGGMGFAYDLQEIGEQLADHALLMHHWHQVFPGEILDVNYEDLLEDPEGVSRKMLDYIGVDWEPQVLAFNELDRPVKTASLWQVRQPIYKSSKAKWMNYQNHLAQLIEGTNARIEIDPAEDGLRFPVPGMFVDGIALYHEGKLDDAEMNFKKVLYHYPDHAAANFMVGLIYVRKQHPEEGLLLMEKGFEKCPWNSNWRTDLIQLYEMLGQTDKAEKLKSVAKRATAFEGDFDEDLGDEMEAESW
ncbi:MAG: sulfotransferase [Zetaproteobacteria bacterium]|nr:sulfotransferase [Zetaproteobacteria bacterium]